MVQKGRDLKKIPFMLSRDSMAKHTFIAGVTGSGKTQTITLPLLELANKAGESVVIHDTKNELYETKKK